MNNKIKKSFMVLAVIWSLLFVGLLCLFIMSMQNYKFWFNESSVDGQNYVYAMQKPRFLFWGSTYVIVKIRGNNGIFVTFDTSIKTHKLNLTEENYKIDFDKEYIKVELIGDDSSNVYYFYYEDMNE